MTDHYPVKPIMSKKEFQAMTHVNFRFRPAILKEIDHLLELFENLDKHKYTQSSYLIRKIESLFFKPPKAPLREQLLEALSEKLFEATLMLEKGSIHKKRRNGIEELQREVLYEMEPYGNVRPSRK